MVPTAPRMTALGDAPRAALDARAFADAAGELSAAHRLHESGACARAPSVVGPGRASALWRGAKPLANLRETVSLPALARESMGVTGEVGRVDPSRGPCATATAVPAVASEILEAVGSGSGYDH